MDSREKPSPKTDDMRSDERQHLVYRPALIESEGFAGFCMVRNLSSRGMKADAYTLFDLGQAVVVELSQILRVNGTIVWSDGSNVGVKFDRPIDVASVLLGRDGSSETAIRGRAPRLSLQCNATIVTERGEMSAWVNDISQQGLKVSISGVRTGEELDVHLPFHPLKRAVVRWTQNETAGLNFVAPMKYNELAGWAIQLQEHALANSDNPLQRKLQELRQNA